jgi:hypothetical protein
VGNSGRARHQEDVRAEETTSNLAVSWTPGQLRRWVFSEEEKGNADAHREAADSERALLACEEKQEAAGWVVACLRRRATRSKYDDGNRWISR